MPFYCGLALYFPVENEVRCLVTYLLAIYIYIFIYFCASYQIMSCAQFSLWFFILVWSKFLIYVANIFSQFEKASHTLCNNFF